MTAAGLHPVIVCDVDALNDVEDRVQAVVLLESSSRVGETIERVALARPDVPLIAVLHDGMRWKVRAALAAGAAGVVLHAAVERALAPCVLAVIAGQTCVPSDHREQIDPPALSSRERQVLGLVVMGFTNSQIADRLFLAESTVKSHLSSAFSKLGVRSRNDATKLILDPERGLGMGILALGAEPVERVPVGFS